MALTNKLGLPAPIVAACENDDYTRGDNVWRSVTQLTGPPRIAVLLETFPEKRTVEDVSDRAHVLQGKAIHQILHDANVDGLAEERLYLEVDGKLISGKFDHMGMDEDSTLTDYKNVNVWSVAIPRFKQAKVIEWTEQLNLYALLLREAKGLFPKRLQVGITCLDGWSRQEAKRNPDYPQAKMMVVPIALWGGELTWAYLKKRIRLHNEAEERLPLCSAEERWQEPAKYAVKKTGRKSAIRGGIHASYDTAAQHVSTLGSGHYIEERPSQPKRCMDYCPMRDFCPTLKDGQWGINELQEGWEEDE